MASDAAIHLKGVPGYTVGSGEEDNEEEDEDELEVESEDPFADCWLHRLTNRLF